jgi:uncharacterized SAM-binding protein YcdF (DUF218 family)
METTKTHVVRSGIADQLANIPNPPETAGFLHRTNHRRAREMTMRSRIKRISLWALLAGLLWCVILGTLIWRYGTHDYATKSDCIIVLGAAVKGAAPSPVFEARIRHGANLYHAGFAPKQFPQVTLLSRSSLARRGRIYRKHGK